MLRRSIVGLAVALLASLQLVSSASALAVPPAPSLAVPIVDQTNTLSQANIDTLAQQIATSRAEKSYQIGILIITTLGSDEYLEGYSLKVAREWGIGEQATSNGVLILIVKNDRQMRIEVGRGLEGDLTDVRANRIIRDVMTPAFKKGDFVGGISGAIDSIQKAVSGVADPKLTQSASSATSNLAEAWIPITFGAFFGFSWVASMLARSKSWWAGGIIGAAIGTGVALFASWAWWTFGLIAALALFGCLFDFLVSRNYQQHATHGTLPAWWAGGGSIGGGSSGGGGGFGGGGFSGGGSSGSW